MYTNLDLPEVVLTNRGYRRLAGAVYVDDVDFVTDITSSITITNNTAVFNGGALVYGSA